MRLHHYTNRHRQVASVIWDPEWPRRSEVVRATGRRSAEDPKAYSTFAKKDNAPRAEGE